MADEQAGVGDDVPFDEDVDGRAAPGSPHAKRQRMQDWAQWELSPMRRLREAGDGLDLQEEVVPKADTLRDRVLTEVRKVEEAHLGWATYPVHFQDAAILLEFASHAIPVDWKSNLFKTQLLLAVLRDVFRAHESGGYERVNCVWRPCSEGFSAHIIQRLEEATKTSMALLVLRWDDLSNADSKLQRRPILRDAVASQQAPDQIERLLEDACHKLASGEGRGWLKQALKELEFLCPSWSRATGNYTNLCKWGFTPRPENNGLIAFVDCVLKFGKGIEQVSRADCSDVYMEIPQSLAYKPSEEYINWFRKYFTTTIAGDMDVMELEFSIESLAIRGMRLPHHCVIYFGSGGNSKGARSRLRAKVFAAGHKWVSPTVFDKTVKDEFRKQGHEFYGAMICTIREADAFEFDEKTFRAWTAGEGVACRLPHAIHTPMLEWPAAGKFWEMNVTKTPKIASNRERSFTRRLVGVEKTATFTCSAEKVDAKAKVFQADDELEDKLESGDAVWCYMRMYLMPWMQKNTPADAKRRITHLTSGLQAQTDRLMDILTVSQGLGQHKSEEQGGDAPASAPPSFNPKSSEFELLRESHKQWQNCATVNAWQINKATWIPTTGKSGARARESRLDVLQHALESPYNFFFDSIHERDAVTPAPFTDITPFLELPREQFGGPEDWAPYSGMSRYRQRSDDGDGGDELDFQERPDSDDEAGEELVIDEIGHFQSLRACQALKIDRRPEVLQQWIYDLADGSDIGDGWREVSVPHYQSHGLPGRFLPRPKSSLAQLTQEARAVSVEGRLSEVDFPISHWKSLYRIFAENGLLDKYPMIKRFVENYAPWRARWGKTALTAVGYGGVPEGEAWNPPTWTLYSQLRNAAVRVLALPQYQYLQGFFSDRPNPIFSRLYYAVCADEVKRLKAAMDDYNENSIPVRAMIYDSLLTEGVSEELNEKHGLVVKSFNRWQDNLFMRLRERGEHTDSLLERLPGKGMCIPISCINVGSGKVQKALKFVTHKGPHSFKYIQQVLVQKKTGQYLKISGLFEIEAAAPGKSFCLYAKGHAAGLSKGG